MNQRLFVPKKSNQPWVFASVFFLLVCAGIYWAVCQSPMENLQKENPRIKVYYETNTPTPVNSVASEIRPSAPTPLPQTQEFIQDETENSDPSQAQRYFFCSVQDVLGEPVENGTIRYATQSIPFKNGHARLERASLPAEPIVLAASAEGYQSATQTIDIQVASEAVFTLDYYCNFTVLVSNAVRRGTVREPLFTPHPGATVTLYRSKLCPRPLGHSQRALVEYEPQMYPSLFEF